MDVIGVDAHALGMFDHVVRGNVYSLGLTLLALGKLLRFCIGVLYGRSRLDEVLQALLVFIQGFDLLLFIK